ncbi:hypothetical protein [Halorubrum ezzemoulense]|uniref:hypothetical protein n=1 Tax=Halorubrum ezzemoulense TaxID=337243 RepID=UPI00211AFCC6|nr:hypothetical protein [Halorubrum ezzemoulense]
MALPAVEAEPVDEEEDDRVHVRLDAVEHVAREGAAAAGVEHRSDGVRDVPEAVVLVRREEVAVALLTVSKDPLDIVSKHGSGRREVPTPSGRIVS